MLEVDQALVSEFIGANFGLGIAHENLNYSPTGDAYAELLVLQNDRTPGTLKHTDDTDGVLRTILRYPVGQGAIGAKTKADEIFSVFRIGRRITYGDVALNVVRHARQPGVAEDGWYKLVVDVSYRAQLKR